MAYRQIQYGTKKRVNKNRAYAHSLRIDTY